MPAVLSFDVDADVDVEALPSLLALLRAHSIRASFACIGEWVERCPAEHRRIAAEGHEVMNHGYAMHTGRDARGVLVCTRFYHSLTPQEMAWDIRAGHAVLQDVLGVTPVGFRAPHFATLRRHQFGPLYATVRELGYSFSSSTSLGSTGDGVPFLADGVVELPLLGCPDHPTSVFDSWHILAAPDTPHAPADLFALSRRIVAAAATSGGPGWINMYFDPSVATACGDFAAVLALLASAPHLEVLSLGDFAGRVRARAGAAI